LQTLEFISARRCVGVVTGLATAVKGVWVATRMEGDKIIKRTQEGVKK
jgi:hypothetical protein